MLTDSVCIACTSCSVRNIHLGLFLANRNPHKPPFSSLCPSVVIISHFLCKILTHHSLSQTTMPIGQSPSTLSGTQSSST